MSQSARLFRTSTHLAVMSLLTAATAQAGFVTWSTPKAITGDADVSVDGTLVVAHNLGTFDNGAATVHGVTFTPFVTSTTSNTVGNVTLSSSAAIAGDNFAFGEIVGPFADLSANYQTLLQSGSFTTGDFPPPTISMTLGGLIPGAQYQFQWWANQAATSNFGPPPPISATIATAGNSVSLERTGNVPGGVGQYALGVFTATAASQTIAFDGTDSRVLLNAFQLRQLGAPAVPEPGSMLFGLAMTGFVFHSASKRRR